MTETIDPISVRAIVLVNIYSEDPRLGCSTLCLWRPPERQGEDDTSLGCHDCSHVVVGQVQSFFTHLL